MLGKISNAYTIEILPPLPVPVAEIWLRHTTSRLNVRLWLSVVQSGQQKRMIWPPYELGADNSGRPFDDSLTLHYRVTLPRESVWPPTAQNQVALDLYDSDVIMRGTGGGEVIALRACV